MTALKILSSMIFLSLLSAAADKAETGEPFRLKRKLELKICNRVNHCETKTFGEEALNLEMERFHSKGNGWHAWDNFKHNENGITFKTQLHVIRHFQPGKHQYYIYAMVRSSTREGRVLMWNLKNLAELRERKLTDKPIAFPGGTMEATLVIAP